MVEMLKFDIIFMKQTFQKQRFMRTFVIDTIYELCAVFMLHKNIKTDYLKLL